MSNNPYHLTDEQLRDYAVQVECDKREQSALPALPTRAEIIAWLEQGQREAERIKNEETHS